MKKIISFINRMLGAVFYLFICLPWIALAVVATFFHFLDKLAAGKILGALVSLVFSPINMSLSLSVGVLMALELGSSIGFAHLLMTARTRLVHFFKHQLPFGMKKEESVSAFFKNALYTSGLDNLTGTGLFGRITLKFYSLIYPMPMFEAYKQTTQSPHNSVNVFFTEKNIDLLKNKYHSFDQQATLEEITAYLNTLKSTAEGKIKSMSSNAENEPGALQNEKNDLMYVETAIRCINRFINTNMPAFDLAKKTSEASVLSMVWLAINAEGKDDASKQALKNSLILTLYLIQRGYNDDPRSLADTPECPTAAIGLLVRVITNQTDQMPRSEYKVEDPSPANLSESLKGYLDLPFIGNSTHAKVARITFLADEKGYREKIAEELKQIWGHQYGHLFSQKDKSGEPILNKTQLDEIIETGIASWDPPDLSA